MSTPIANVTPSINTWGQLIARFNDICYALSTVSVTTAANTSGGITSGNGYVQGIFGSNTLFAQAGLRGGNVTSTANLVFLSNTTFTGATATINSNVFITSSNVTINANLTSNGLASFASNVAIAGILTTSANVLPSSNGLVFGSTTERWDIFSNNIVSSSFSTTSFSANVVSISTIGEVSTNSNTNLEAVGTKVVASYPISTYRSGVVSLSGATPAGDYQRSDISFIHNGVDVFYTTGGIVYSNTQFFSFDANLNGANVEIRVTPTIANVSISLLAQLIKG